MADPVSGEVRHLMDGTVWIFRPSFRAIMEIESELGPVLPLAQKIAAGNFGFREVAVILAATSGRELADVGDALLRAGVADLVEPVRALLMQILTGADMGQTDMGKLTPPVG